MSGKHINISVANAVTTGWNFLENTFFLMREQRDVNMKRLIESEYVRSFDGKLRILFYLVSN